MESNQKTDIYDENSSYQASNQNIKVTEPNILNNSFIEQIEIINSQNNDTNNKNNIIYKSVNIFESKKTNDILNNEETKIKKANTERNSNNLFVKTETIEKNINQPQKEVNNIEIKSTDNKESSEDQKDCCESCKNKCKGCFNCYCSDTCKKITYAILFIISILTLLIFLIYFAISCLELFEICGDLKNIDCSCCKNRCRCCCCCKKKQEEINKK